MLSILGKALLAILIAQASAHGQSETSATANKLLNGRIIGGIEAEDRFRNVMALLYVEKPAWRPVTCSATIVDPKWLLTAAHCVKYGNGLQHVADLETSFALPMAKDAFLTPGTKRYYFSSVYVHKDYRGYDIAADQRNDIALIELLDEVPRENYQKLHISSPPINATEVTALGYGLIGLQPPEPASKLMQTAVVYRPFSDCVSQESSSIRKYLDYEKQLCALSIAQRTTDTCRGDSGGPLLKEEHGVICQFATTSFSTMLGCGVSGQSWYVRLAGFERVIEDLILHKIYDENFLRYSSGTSEELEKNVTATWEPSSEEPELLDFADISSMNSYSSRFSSRAGAHNSDLEYLLEHSELPAKLAN